MNILIPHTWLLEHLDTKITPTELQKLVSLSGPSVERIYNREGDSVYDVEITTNRVDSMSIRGFAREAAVILNQEDKETTLKKPKIQLADIEYSQELPLPTIHDNPDLNTRTMCVVLDTINRAETPDWMATRLTQVEMNVHDAAIDITNYVTHELGHPCHAFDYDKLMATGGEIHIVEAKKDETLTTLDGETYQTKGGEVVFKDATGTIIDLPSIKGTKNTSVDESTTRILLLLESIRADKVRFASMTHAIRTTAAQLMEKNLDPHLADDTLALGIHLYQEICNATVASPIYDSFAHSATHATTGTTSNPAISPKTYSQTSITLPINEVKRYLGISLSSAKIADILERLGCQVTIKDENIVVTPPTFRSDLHIPADIIEEIARIYGYHNLPSTLPDTPIPTNYQPNTNFSLEHSLKKFLAHTGWQEVYTYSMVSKELATESGYSLDSHLKLSNPLTEDMVYLRRSLLPSLVEVIDANPTHRPLSVFEWAVTYDPANTDTQEIPTQDLHIGLVSTQKYTHLKGSVEALLKQVYISIENELVVNRDTKAKPGFLESATLKVGDVQIGHIGMLRKSDYAGATLNWSKILQVAKQNPTYKPVPKTSLVTEDITVTLVDKTEIGSVLQTIRESHKLVYKAHFVGQYNQNASFRLTFHDAHTNISSDDLEPVRKKIVQMLNEKHKAKLVGKI